MGEPSHDAQAGQQRPTMGHVLGLVDDGRASSALLPPGARLAVSGLFLMVHDAWGCTSVEWWRPWAWWIACASAHQRATEFGQEATR